MTDSRPQSSVRRTLPACKRIALIAHDGKKAELLAWAEHWRDTLVRHELVGTGTTAGHISAHLGLEIEGLMSGPLGGDQQVGARITEQRLDLLIFFWDPFAPQPHDPDVKALLRLATLWNLPVACNAASADFLISSPWLNQPYEMDVPDSNAWIATRALE